VFIKPQSYWLIRESSRVVVATQKWVTDLLTLKRRHYKKYHFAADTHIDKSLGCIMHLVSLYQWATFCRRWFYGGIYDSCRSADSISINRFRSTRLVEQMGERRYYIDNADFEWRLMGDY